MIKRSRVRINNYSKPSSFKNGMSEGVNTRSRGNAQHLFDKYNSLASEASAAGDRITAESYYQHAEHYLRTMNDLRSFTSPDGSSTYNRTEEELIDGFDSYSQNLSSLSLSLHEENSDNEGISP